MTRNRCSRLICAHSGNRVVALPNGHGTVPSHGREGAVYAHSGKRVIALPDGHGTVPSHHREGAVNAHSGNRVVALPDGHGTVPSHGRVGAVYAYPNNRVVLLVSALVLLAACGSVRYPSAYILNFPPPPARAATSQPSFGPLLIRELSCPTYLCEGRIVYRPNDEEIGFYEYHRWAQDPRQSVTRFLAETVRAQGIFQYVAAEERGAQAAYVLTGRIEQLEEVDRGSDVRVVCTISAQMLDAQTGSVVWSESASETLPVEQRDVRGVVRALTSAANNVVGRLAQSMGSRLAAKQ